MSICTTTVYDANYTLQNNGTLSLDTSSFVLANASATIAVSSSGMYLGRNETRDYGWGPRFIDEQIQTDLSIAGNTYGNHSDQFAAAWAQSFSNRYLGWSVGAIRMDDTAATLMVSVLGLSIPMSTSYAFIGLHFAYALSIVLLGISCFFIPQQSPKRRFGSDSEDNVVGRWTSQDLVSAQTGLTDSSILVYELAEWAQTARQTRVNAEDGEEDSLWGTEGYTMPPLKKTSTRTSLSSLLPKVDDGVDRNDDIRVRLERRKAGGRLRFAFNEYL